MCENFKKSTNISHPPILVSPTLGFRNYFKNQMYWRLLLFSIPPNNATPAWSANCSTRTAVLVADKKQPFAERTVTCVAVNDIEGKGGVRGRTWTKSARLSFCQCAPFYLNVPFGLELLSILFSFSLFLALFDNARPFCNWKLESLGRLAKSGRAALVISLLNKFNVDSRGRIKSLFE